MAGQPINDIDQATRAAEELHTLLETGPFALALRTAIRVRGLGLERIQYRLRRRGVPVSLATLSHWQSGRSRPDRPNSFAALAVLEQILRVPSGALLRLLTEEEDQRRAHGVHKGHIHR